MTRVLYVLRHAKSSWADPALDDFDRPLAGRGRRAGAAMRKHMKEARVRPSLVLCSPAARTRQTLEAVLPALGGGAEVDYEDDLYLAGAAHWIARLQRVPDTVRSVMIVGHNPGFHGLARALAGGGDAEALARLRLKFPTAGLATLILGGDRWRGLDTGACTLVSFVVPRDLE